MVEGHVVRGPRHRTPLPAITIGDYLTAVASRGPCCRAPVGDGTAHPTYAELALDVERVACGLLALGVEKGDRIAIWARSDSLEWTLVQFAAARAGAVLVIVDGDWDVRELGPALHETGARLLVAGSTARLRQLAQVRNELAGLERVVAIAGVPCGGHDDLTWSELLVTGSAIDAGRLAEREATLHPDDPVSIEYTRLASGELEATTLTHRDYLAVAGE
jgi:fatty-acyl-CoA synthase